MEEFLMSENKSNNKRISNFVASPVVLIRISAVLFFLLMIGHMSAYPWSSTHGSQETQLVDAMKSIAFVFFGENSTYWNLYFGWGLLVGILLITLAIILWILSDLAIIAPRRLGVVAGIVSVSCMIGAYISFQFFYVLPVLFFAAICAVLLTASFQLLKQ